MKIGFIGGGNMAEAILSAILVKKIAQTTDITVSDIAEARREYLCRRYQVTATSDNVAAVQDKDVIILAVKPQVLADVMAGLKGRLQPDQLVISIVAGKSIATISNGLEHKCVVRSMPNTPAQIGEGMTVWTASAEVSPRQRRCASSILGVMGLEIVMDNEKYLDMATAISGSGPAYVFLFVESFIAAAIKLGFSPDIAHKLVMQTLTGSAHLLQNSNKTPEELRKMVTSPGGTTAAAIAALEQGSFSDLVAQAARAAYDRAVQLGS
jgi:pyrroline-5-carboxylate reductase